MVLMKTILTATALLRLYHVFQCGGVVQDAVGGNGPCKVGREVEEHEFGTFRMVEDKVTVIAVPFFLDALILF